LKNIVLNYRDNFHKTFNDHKEYIETQQFDAQLKGIQLNEIQQNANKQNAIQQNGNHHNDTEQKLSQ
jgi:predicted double-glycine peptidase